jgi:hypothetical protein
VSTLAVDFDVPIHRYSRGWHDGTLYDPPTEGSLDAIADLMQHHAVFVHTVRDPEQVVPWLQQFGLRATSEMPSGPFWSDRKRLLVTRTKLPALAYVDDRAVRHVAWPQTLADLAVILR